MIFPWHKSAWERITQSADSLHHGLLVQSAPGSGLDEFCFTLARWLICDAVAKTREDRCGNCQSCRLFDAGTHPDIHVLTTEQQATGSAIDLVRAYSDRYLDRNEIAKKSRPGTVISVEQVRSMIERLALGSHISSRRVGLVMPADALNVSAANAFLKLLEEPPPGVIFILGTDQPWRLPRTIISRCVKVDLDRPSEQQSLDWLADIMEPSAARNALALAHGGPQRARELHESGALADMENYISGLQGVIEHRVLPVALAPAAAKLDFEQSLRWFQKFVAAALGWCLGREIADFPLEIQRDRQSVSVPRLFSLYDKITQYQRIARGNVNQQMVHEELLIFLERTAR